MFSYPVILHDIMSFYSRPTKTSQLQRARKTPPKPRFCECRKHQQIRYIYIFFHSQVSFKTVCVSNGFLELSIYRRIPTFHCTLLHSDADCKGPKGHSSNSPSENKIGFLSSFVGSIWWKTKVAGGSAPNLVIKGFIVKNNTFMKINSRWFDLSNSFKTTILMYM